ncbi:hypothetical protein [Pedobacter frigidisoli]|uniref:hypothetical protein n=1 Tax=Pedobacter frigidisoli TaxID=2530455 RepID=UPI0029311417|nr:hypothetical protein [Pedobacter frigidisoli]
MEPTHSILEDHFGKIYHKSLVTPLFTFFTDDGDGIIMFYRKDPGRTPLFGYGAEEMLLDVVLMHEWLWASEDMKYNIRCILEEQPDP